jgi:hypothetical protein
LNTFNNKHLTKEEKKTLFKHYTINNNNLVKVRLKNINNIKKEFFNDINIFENYLLKKFKTIKKESFLKIKKQFLENLFNNIELKVNEFIAYTIIPDLIYDIDNTLYDIKYEVKDNIETAFPVNTYLYCDFSDYENIHHFLEVNYESELRPFHHDNEKLTLYCLKQGYIENFDKFIAFYIEDVVKNVLLKFIEKEDYLFLEHFNIFDNKYGKIILSEFLIQVSRPYLNIIFDYNIKDLIYLFNFEENKKYIEVFNERSIEQKKYIKKSFENNKILENFVNELSNNKSLKIEIGEIIFLSNNKNFKNNLLDHLIILFFHNKTFSFIIREQTNIDNTIKFSGFLYLDRKEIIYFEKKDFENYFSKIKNSKKIAYEFKFKKILDELNLRH